MDIWYTIAFLSTGIHTLIGYDDLSTGKDASQSNVFSCKPPCGPDKAVDGDIRSCMKTYDIGQLSSRKTVWWSVDLGGKNIINAISINFRQYAGYEMRQRGRFAGFALYISNTPQKEDGHLCYKNTLPLPPLEFNTTCIGYGRYVIYYNERLDGVTYPVGYHNPTYTQLCEVKVEGCAKAGVYGVNCSLPCSKNCHEDKCNIVNGTCLSCGQGWTGDKCTEKCKLGWYGLACKNRCVGQCRGHTACNHVTGYCEDGCADGWMGKLCVTPCEAGSYGPDCAHNCSGYCSDTKYCNNKNGHCDNGCSTGYSGDLCDKLCSPGSFGKGCSEKCSETCKNKNCDHMNGTCIDGCVDGFTGINCSNKCNKGHFGTNCTGICPLECNYTCQHTDGSCIQSQRVKDSHSSEAESTSTNASTVGGILGACTFIIITVVLVVLFLRYKRRVLSKYSDMPMKTLSVELPTGKLSSKSSNKARDEHVQSVKRAANDEQEKAKKGPPTKKNIPVINLNAIIAKMSAGENSGFKHEYHEIPRGELCPCEEAKKPENKPKNRYTTTFAYDHSRVVLKKTQEGNYINANYIENALHKRTYIATQGPKPKTIADFWQMVWQEEVTVIVCLTNLKEGGKNKCAQYWPDVNDKLQTGDLTLRNLEEKTYSNYTQRRFKAYNVLEQKDREVVMFHYTRWPDHGVPDPLNLVVFHRHVMKTSPQNRGKYTLVHCSAGIGRTGTFIALDALYREGERNGKINVPMYVRTMRKDRMNMIQGDDQYKTVYLALCEYFNGKSRCLTPSMFTKEFQDKTYTNCGQVTKNSSLASEFQTWWV